MKRIYQFLLCMAAALPLISKAVDTEIGLPRSRLVDQVMHIVDRNYYRSYDKAAMKQHCVDRMRSLPSDIPWEEQISICIDAMIASLDSTSTYLPKAAFDRLRSREGKPSALENLTYRHETDWMELRAVAKSDHAYAAGLRAGDRIESLEGISLAGMTPNQRYQLIDSHDGDSVTLTVRRASKKTSEKIVVRRIIRTQGELKANRFDNIIYLRIPLLGDGLRRTLTEKIAKLDMAPSGWIVDLRGCPGGLLNGIPAVVGMFLPEDAVVVKTVSASPTGETMYRASDVGKRFEFGPRVTLSESMQRSLHEAPIVVLIDGDTAVGAEYAAAALQELRNATLFGEPTAGVNAVHTITMLTKDTAMKIRSAEMETPSGRRIGEEGLAPDHAAPAVSTSDVGFGTESDAALRLAIAHLRN